MLILKIFNKRMCLAHSRADAQLRSNTYRLRVMRNLAECFYLIGISYQIFLQKILCTKKDANPFLVFTPFHIIIIINLFSHRPSKTAPLFPGLYDCRL